MVPGRSFKCLAIDFGKVFTRYILEAISSIVTILFSPKRCRIPPITDAILVMPAIKLSEKIRRGELKCEQVVEVYIRRIKEVNKVINAVVDSSRFELALEEARKIDARVAQGLIQGDQALAGIPFTVKETICLKNNAYSAGLPARRLKKASYSNQSVDKLIANLLIPLASTNTPCMNMWWDTDNMLYGRTVNPYDLSRIVGGSSGGEAAMLAAAGSLVGIGSDLAGSIRIPCNFCGIFGHKPTPFTVDNDGVFPKMRREQEKLRGVGPMARYSCDLIPMLKIMVKDDEILSKLNLDEQVDMRRLKVYYCQDINDPLVSRCNSDIAAGFKAAIEHLRSEYNIPTEAVVFDEFRNGMFLWGAEMNNVPEGMVYSTEHEDGIVKFDPLVELAKKAINSSDYTFNTIFTRIAESTSPKYGSPRNCYLVKKAEELRQKFYKLVGDDGVFLMPTHPEAAPIHQTTIFKIFNVAYTALGNTLHAPITQCPLGMSSEGLPFGLQIIAKPFNDRLTLAVAQEMEKAFGGWSPPTRVTV